MRMKYSLTFIIALIIAIVGRAQRADVLIVSGELDFVTEGKRMLDITYRKIGGGFIFDSCIINNGHFKFQKEINEPIVVILSLKPLHRETSNQGKLDYVSLFLLPGEVHIKAPQNLSDCIVSGKGSIANNDYQAYSKDINLYIDTQNKALRILQNSNEDEKEKRITVITDSLNSIRDRVVYLKFITTKKQSPVAALALLQYGGEPVWTPRKKMVPDEIERLLIKLPKQYQLYPSIQNLKEELKVAKSTGVGKPIIDFALEDTAGKKVKLSDFKGQYVFLDFWASWCVPCRKENPNVKAVFEKYKDKNFIVVSVSLDKEDAKGAWRSAIQKDQIALWPHLVDFNGFGGAVAKSYYVKSIPTNFLIGPDGKFLGRNLYGEALNRAVDKIFNNSN